MLSLACMMKGAEPKAIQGKIIFACNFKFFNLIFNNVFLPNKKANTKQQETN